LSKVRSPQSSTTPPVFLPSFFGVIGFTILNYDPQPPPPPHPPCPQCRFTPPRLQGRKGERHGEASVGIVRPRAWDGRDVPGAPSPEGPGGDRAPPGPCKWEDRGGVCPFDARNNWHGARAGIHLFGRWDAARSGCRWVSYFAAVVCNSTRVQFVHLWIV